MNAINVINPYKDGAVWIFDDPVHGLNREPFVGDTNRMIDLLTAEIPDAEKGFQLIFSASPFPGFDAEFIWKRGDEFGNWYYWPRHKIEGWLCSALFRYFEKAPKHIYVQAKGGVE